MTPSRTLVIDDAVPYAKELFSHLGNVISLPGKEINTEHLQNADALIVRSRTQVNAALLEHSNVSFVGSTVVGLDHVDQPYLKEHAIEFYSAQGCNANSVSEYVMTNIVNLAIEKKFKLSEKSLAIIGVGHVGKLVEKKARALGITVLLNDPPRARQEMSDEFIDLDSALKADIITVHTPLTKTGQDTTYHLLSADKLKKIQPHQILINAARGGIIDEQAWINTPTESNIIDCWENEPNINPDLYNKADIATPHIAGHALDAKIAGSEMVYRALCQHWKIPPDDSWRQFLPPPPPPISLSLTGNHQKDIHNVLQQCYRPEEDDAAIRANNIVVTHKKYEYYRRHYPVHREWPQHRVTKTPDPTFNNLLYSLGFQLI